MDIRRRNSKGVRNVINLIKKDIAVTIGKFIAGIILIFIFAPMILLAVDIRAVYSLFIFINLSMIMLACNTDLLVESNNNINLLMISLPIVRKDVVKSKFIVYGMYSVLYNILMYASVNFMCEHSFLAEIGGIQDGLGPEIILCSLGICLIYLGIIIPLYYYSGEKSNIIGYVLFFSILGLPKLIGMLIESSIIEGIIYTNFWIAILTFIVALIIYFTSLKISISIYSNKEF